jgi:hypothetical protein
MKRVKPLGKLKKERRYKLVKVGISKGGYYNRCH